MPSARPAALQALASKSGRKMSIALNFKHAAATQHISVIHVWRPKISAQQRRYVPLVIWTQGRLPHGSTDKHPRLLMPAVARGRESACERGSCPYLRHRYAPSITAPNGR
jgi:hypothetical protein